MVRRRLIINVVLMLFLWGTIAPAAYSPCCCKKAGKASKAGVVKSCCAQKMSTTPCCAASQKPAKSCCSTKSNTSCAPKSKAFSCGCPICPFSKQMQAATGSGQTHVESVKRVQADIEVPIESSDYFHCTSDYISDAGESHLTGITILSRTCSLLI